MREKPIRSNAILYCSNKPKARSFQLQNIENEFTRLDSKLEANFTDQTALKQFLAKKEMTNFLKQKSEFLLHRM